jgi:hypothetical protein
MPVKRTFHLQIILNENLDFVSFIDINQRPRLLAVDKVHVALEPIYGTIVLVS